MPSEPITLPLDLYRLDDLLEPPHKSLRDRVRRWVEQTARPKMVNAYEEDTFPMELTSELATLGAFGSSIKGWGCPGLDALSYGLIMQELEAGDSGLRTFASVQGALAMTAIALYGSEEQRETLLPQMAQGACLGCFGLTEPDHGSDPGGMETTAQPSSDGWVLNGQKLWIGNAPVADVAIVWAKAIETPSSQATSASIRGFVVPTSSQGFESQQMTGKLSLRAAITGSVSLTDCVVNHDALLPDASGLSAPLACLDQARYGIAFGAVGAAQACFMTALEHACSRQQFGRPLARNQLVQAKLAEMATDLTHAQLTAHRLAQLKDAGTVTTAQISLAKRANVEIARRTADRARDLLGGIGILNDHHVMRHMCNLESVRTYEGTHDIHTLILGRALTGLSAFRDESKS